MLIERTREMQNNNQLVNFAKASLYVLVVLAPTVCLGATFCKDSSGNSPTCVGTNSPCICVERSATMTEGVDFDLTFNGANPPDVTLKSGASDWKVWCKVSENDSTPDDIGTITIPASSSLDFSLKVLTSSGGDGAANVAAIDLDSASYTGNSNVLDGVITGDLGDLEVHDARGIDGKINLTVDGDVTGTLEARSIEDFHVKGDFSGSLNAETIEDGKTLDIDGTLTGSLTFSEDVVGDLVIDKMEGPVQFTKGLTTGSSGDADITIESWIKGAQLSIFGNVTTSPNKITVADMQSSASVDSRIIIGDYTAGNPKEFWAILELENGVPADQIVALYSEVEGGSKIDLNNKDVAGTLFLARGGYGLIQNGGAVKNGGNVSLTGLVIPYFYQGIADFSEVESGGLITLLGNSDLRGTININGPMAGEIEVGEGFSSTGRIAIDGAFSGTLDINDDIANNTIAPSIAIDGAVSGDIDIDGDLAGDISAGSTSDYTGDIDISGTLSGDISTGGDLAGRIDIDGDNSGTIDVGGELGSGGDIFVQGSMTGDVTIGQGTDVSSDIVFSQGMGSGSSVVINDDQGAHAADGDILLGSKKAPLPDIDTDGCILIRVYDTNPPQPNAYGDLDGDINIAGCHSGNVDINICANVNLGAIAFDQGGCSSSYSTAYSCQGGCP